MELVFRQGSPQGAADFAFAAVGGLPFGEADFADDVVDVVDDALDDDGSLGCADLFEEFGEGGFAAIFVFFLGDFFFGVDQVAGEPRRMFAASQR